ncbi:MAG: MFS transporter [Nocardioides sp.]|uniref:MFS transporter n=1 Tax=Nocardioides sp. TaxID=35761 RepID=UPI0039E44979
MSADDRGSAGDGGIADLTPVLESMERQQKAWNWYDWANSAFYTTTLSVLFGPYLATVAGRAAGCSDTTDVCDKTVAVLGIPIAAGSMSLYLTSVATVVSALVLPIVGAFADRSPRKKVHMATYAWLGAASASLMFFMRGDHWQIGVISMFFSSILAGCSLVSYYAILVDISTEDQRDAVSSRGWAWGYLGGGLLLVINLVMVQMHDTFGIDKEMAVRLSLLSAAAWWAAFTIIPFVRLRNYAPRNVVPEEGGLFQRSFGQLITTLKQLPQFPMTMTFLLAYLFYNDGIQTVIYAASIYGQKQLGFDESVLIAAILMIQFVAFGGALFFGRLAARYGSYRSILWGTFVWMGIVTWAMVLPRENLPLFLATGVAIGVVLGGTQALSRSFFSLLIPKGKEGEFFALYNAAERGTSWFGTLVFALVFQLSGSYRPAIFALIIFFVLGAFFLIRLDPREGIREAGNRVPQVV